MIYPCEPAKIGPMEAGHLADRILERARLVRGKLVVVVQPEGLLVVEWEEGCVGERADILGIYTSATERAWLVDDLCSIANGVEDEPELMRGRQPILNLCGERFGRLRVESEAPRDEAGNRVWVCHCACGRVLNVTQAKLRSRAVSSCGCARQAVLRTFKERGWRQSGRAARA